LRSDVKTNDRKTKLTFYTDKVFTETDNCIEPYDKNDLRSANEMLSISDMSISECIRQAL